MEQNKEMSFEESIKMVMHTLPVPIRNYLGQGTYSDVANRLMTTYNLHIDQGGVVEREIMMLLMGVKNPDEFVQALAEDAKLDQQTINSITKDVNDQIFVPLREQMQKSGGEAPQTAPVPQRAPAPMPVPKPATAIPPVAQPVQPPPVQQSTPVREAVLPPLTTIIPANPFLPPRQPETFVPIQKYTPPTRSVQQPPRSAGPTTPRQTQSDRLLEDHEEPHIEFRRNMAPPNLPGQMLPQPTNPQQWASNTTPRPVPPAPQTPRPLTPRLPAQPYSSDPYREPIDGK